MEKDNLEKNLQMLEAFNAVDISNMMKDVYEITLKEPHFDTDDELLELLAIYDKGNVGIYIRGRDYSDTGNPKINLKDLDTLRDVVSKLVGYKI